MRKSPILIIVVLVFLSCGNSKNEIQVDYLITNVNVIPISEETVLENQTVGIYENQIVYIGSDSPQINMDVQLIDGTNKYLMPGLSDMHAHLPSKDIENYFRLNLINGITKIRSMRGSLEHLKLRDQIIKDKILAPKIYYGAPPTFTRTEFNASNADSLISSYKTAGFGFVKFLSIKDSISFVHLVAAAKKYDIGISGHVSSRIGLEPSLSSGVYRSIEHLGGYVKALEKGEDYFNQMVELTIQHDIYNDATLDWYNMGTLTKDELLQKSGLDLISETSELWVEQLNEELAKKHINQIEEEINQAKEKIAIKKRILKRLFDKGAKILISPDASGSFGVPGFSLLNEMKHYKSAGLSNYEILKIATYNTAEFFGELGEFGTVEIGKKADLILVIGNPIENLDHLSNIEKIFIQGKVYNSDSILSSLKNQ